MMAMSSKIIFIFKFIIVCAATCFEPASALQLQATRSVGLSARARETACADLDNFKTILMSANRMRPFAALIGQPRVRAWLASFLKYPIWLALWDVSEWLKKTAENIRKAHSDKLKKNLKSISGT